MFIIRKDTQNMISTTILPHMLSLQIYAQKQKFHVPTLYIHYIPNIFSLRVLFINML